MRRVPVRLRVAAAFAIAMALVLGATSWFLYAQLDTHLGAALDRDLRLRAQDLAALVREPQGSLTAATGGRFIERGESYAQLIDPRGRVVDATRTIGTKSLLTPSELGAGQERSFFTSRDSTPGLDEPSRLLVTPFELRGRRLVLAVGATLGDRAETVLSLRDELLIAGPIALALASLVGYFLAGLALRPVESMRRRAAAISGEDPGGRLPVPPTRDELQRLGETLNQMLARLENALQRERDFVADAGHELRTPLALLRTELELALRHGGSPEEMKEALTSSSQEVERLTQLAEHLLLIAHADRGRLALKVESLDVSKLLEGVVTRFSWRAEEAGRRLAVGVSNGVSVEADRVRVEQALGNLVDNALRHGEGDVLLSATSAGDTVELHVTDEGRGFPRGFIDQAFERFARSDQARSQGGSGLGLSIVRAVVEAHGGTVQAANSTGGGTDVWIVLPAPGH